MYETMHMGMTIYLNWLFEILDMNIRVYILDVS
jgi:hypothetical protein